MIRGPNVEDVLKGYGYVYEGLSRLLRDERCVIWGPLLEWVVAMANGGSVVARYEDSRDEVVDIVVLVFPDAVLGGPVEYKGREQYEKIISDVFGLSESGMYQFEEDMLTVEGDSKFGHRIKVICLWDVLLDGAAWLWVNYDARRSNQIIYIGGSNGLVGYRECDLRVGFLRCGLNGVVGVKSGPSCLSGLPLELKGLGGIVKIGRLWSRWSEDV